MASAEVPVSGVCELVLEQNDLAAAEKFYVGVLGFPVVERWSRNGDAVWVMAGDRTRIGLWRPQLGLGEGRGGVHVHYALHIDAADMDATIARLETASDPAAEGRQLCLDLMQELASIPGVAGVHIMAPGNEAAIVDVLRDAARIKRAK